MSTSLWYICYINQSGTIIDYLEILFKVKYYYEILRIMSSFL